MRATPSAALWLALRYGRVPAVPTPEPRRFPLRWCARPLQIASRLGDGIIWYVLVLLLPLIYGRPAVRPAIVMALTGIARGVAVYAGSSAAGARAAVHPPPRHHAGDAAAGSLQLPVRPHAARGVVHLAGGRALPGARLGAGAARGLIAASRVVLGLHYPSDVLAGGAIGAWHRGARPRLHLAHARPVHLGRLLPARQRRLHLDPHFPP